jgi:Flp pilus assembly protein TadD
MKRIANLVFCGSVAVALALVGPGCKRRPDPAALLQHAVNAAGTGQLDQAIRDFGEVIRLQPTNALAYGLRGTTFYAKGDYDRAIQDFSQALRLNPRDIKAYTSRAYAACSKGNYTQAIQDFDQVLRLEPKDFYVYNAMAWLLATCPNPPVRDGKRALALARKACDLSGWKEWRCLGTLGAACAESGDFASAVKFQKQAMAMPGLTPADTKSAQARLDLYQRRQPYHDPARH